MRKWNAIISGLILLLLLVHGVMGGYQMFGTLPGGNTTVKALSWLMAGLVVLHMIIGVKLTADTIKAVKKTGVFYWKDNLLFFVRRISGFALILLLLYHAVLFAQIGSENFRLHLFEGPQLAGSLLLVVTLAVHLLSNLKPFFTGIGKPGLKKIAASVLLFLSIVLCFCAAAFVFYYFRWNLLWKG